MHSIIMISAAALLNTAQPVENPCPLVLFEKNENLNALVKELGIEKGIVLKKYTKTVNENGRIEQKTCIWKGPSGSALEKNK